MILFLRSYKSLLATSLFHALLNEENREERSDTHLKLLNAKQKKTTHMILKHLNGILLIQF